MDESTAVMPDDEVRSEREELTELTVEGVGSRSVNYDGVDRPIHGERSARFAHHRSVGRQRDGRGHCRRGRGAVHRGGTGGRRSHSRPDVYLPRVVCRR